MNIGTHIISEGKKHRELVEITKQGSRTYHQTKINGEWIDTRSLGRG